MAMPKSRRIALPMSDGDRVTVLADGVRIGIEHLTLRELAAVCAIRMVPNAATDSKADKINAIRASYGLPVFESAPQWRSDEVADLELPAPSPTEVAESAPLVRQSTDRDAVAEQERLAALNKLRDWKASDPTVASMVNIVCAHHSQPDIGHLARFEPDVFDDLFEECEAMVLNPEM